MEHELRGQGAHTRRWVVSRGALPAYAGGHASDEARAHEHVGEDELVAALHAPDPKYSRHGLSVAASLSTASLSLARSRSRPARPRAGRRGGGGGVCLELGVALLDPLQRLHPARARRPRAHQPARAPESGPCAHRPARAGDGRLPGPREHTRPPPLTLAVPTQARTHVPRRSKRAREGGCWRACALLAACDSRHVATPGLPGGAIGDLRLLRGPGGGGGAW